MKKSRDCGFLTVGNRMLLWIGLHGYFWVTNVPVVYSTFDRFVVQFLSSRLMLQLYKIPYFQRLKKSTYSWRSFQSNKLCEINNRKCLQALFLCFAIELSRQYPNYHLPRTNRKRLLYSSIFLIIVVAETYFVGLYKIG